LRNFKVFRVSNQRKVWRVYQGWKAGGLGKLGEKRFMVYTVAKQCKKREKIVGFLVVRKYNKKMDGTIKTLTERGFGFISREGEDKDLFFHSKELKGVAFDELKAGDAVTFDLINGDKGPAAVNVARA